MGNALSGHSPTYFGKERSILAKSIILDGTWTREIPSPVPNNDSSSSTTKTAEKGSWLSAALRYNPRLRCDQ
eukprot:796533-Prorocentrum_minimum.AAC.3